MSKHDGDLVRGAREHVFALFRAADHLPLEYHQFTRTREIVAACKEIAKGSKLDEEARELVLLCAWFHDACYAMGTGDHARSVGLCIEFLQQQPAPRPTPDEIAACFRGVLVERTAPAGSDGVPVGRETPSDVLHDARLAVLASEDYLEQAEVLRLELQRRSERTFSDVEWTQHCIAFFGANPYRTRFAQLSYGGQRAVNMARLQKLLRRQQRELEQERAAESSVAKRVGRSAETLYYHFTRIQLGLIGLADRRTSTMIHVNAIMTSIVVALLARRIQTDRDLVLPTVLLLCVNLTVIFLAIYSMRAGGRRARLGTRTLSPEEIRVHDSNLLAATNESRVSLSEYRAQMSALLADPEQFQRKVIEHLYLGREELVARGKALRITYSVFLYGITLALLAFVMVLVRR
jgi:predicted metal-dependent HD superfamily phosphohydrolase